MFDRHVRERLPVDLVADSANVRGMFADMAKIPRTNEGGHGSLTQASLRVQSSRPSSGVATVLASFQRESSST